MKRSPKATTPCVAEQGWQAAAPTMLSRRALAHELHVHQIELEQQNEELQRAQGDLASARDRFIDLFDFAPVAYLTLDDEGYICEANLMAATELGADRQAIVGEQFARYIAPSYLDRWQRLKAAALRSSDLHDVDLLIRRRDGEGFHAQVTCLAVLQPRSAPQLRITLTNVTQRRLAETNYRIAISGQAARESERRSVAHTLHEDLAQRLSALKLSVGLLQSPRDAISVGQVAASMDAQIDEALVLVRQMAASLHPLMLDNLGLSAAFDGLARDVATRFGIEVDFHLDYADPPQAGISGIAIYRIAEAVLQHLARHVDGGISFELVQRPQDLVLQFLSEAGHARPDAPDTGIAVVDEALMDQLHLLGGRLDVGELPAGGRRICVFLPSS